MDPEEARKKMLRLADKIIGDSTPDPHTALELAETIQALDRWIRGGGFLPEEWDEKKRAAKDTNAAHAIRLIRKFQSEGYGLDSSARMYVKFCQSRASQLISEVGLHPSSEPEIAAVQRVFR